MKFFDRKPQLVCGKRGDLSAELFLIDGSRFLQRVNYFYKKSDKERTTCVAQATYGA
jgi:hypothetical protein